MIPAEIRKAKRLRKHLLELVNDLDGWGLVVTDEKLIKDRLKQYGGFETLRDAFTCEEPDNQN